ncbi:MAG: DUF5915 domain-containing protein, partial [Pirellulaceae bacterium]
AKEGWAAAQGGHCVVVLSTELTPELIREGMARDVIRLVQDRRKEMDLQFTDRIILGLVTDSAELRQAIDENSEYIKSETLAVELFHEPVSGAEPAERDVADSKLVIYIMVGDGATV